MTVHQPIAGPELEEIRERCVNAPLGLYSRMTLTSEGNEETVYATTEEDAEKVAQCMLDLPRCIAEVIRLQPIEAAARKAKSILFSVPGRATDLGDVISGSDAIHNAYLILERALSTHKQ